ncbi:MAG: ABC transporter ATP-binding protein [Candidatus Eremiobacteraeota bacterium]|nr:ABC transporter ATP-binding protein [Candidatus Eremiobacteraeota bacterium]
MSGAILAVADNVTKTYGSSQNQIAAVEHATCAVRAGDHVALFGPSGSGKSTLLQLLGGLDFPTAGTVNWPTFGGITDLRPRNIAFVFQNQTLLPALSARENVEVPRLLQGANATEARSGALETLDRLGLLGLADKLPEELSGGQAQRVAFARALAGRPQLILADEPTGQLDHQTAADLFDVIIPWADELGCALVIATHDRAVGERMSATWSIVHGVLEVVS